jgi:hypothetical protein
MQSIIIRKSRNRQPVYHYPVHADNRTLVNLYFRHSKTAVTGKQVTSIRRGAFEISLIIPTFHSQAISYTRPVNYY